MNKIAAPSDFPSNQLDFGLVMDCGMSSYSSSDHSNRLPLLRTSLKTSVSVLCDRGYDLQFILKDYLLNEL